MSALAILSPHEASAGPSALRLEGISHAMAEAGRMKPVLAALSHAFDAGSFHVVGGPSGAGKTTLLSILALTVRPTGGAVLWRGQDLSALKPAMQAEWRRSNLGMIFQTSRLVSVMNVAQHITLAAMIRRQGAAVARGEALLETLGMADKRQQFPAQLSGGEKQRVAIAQALASQPPVLLADEPTAALDGTNAALVAQTLRTYAREHGAVVICVSHDSTVIDAADHVLMLERP